MKLLKAIFLFCALSLLLTSACIYYAFKVEPYRVKVNNYTMNPESAGTSRVKILQFSDLHIKKDFTHKNMDKVIKKINAQKPDIVIFTGDLYDNYALYRDNENIIAGLRKINAKYGKFAIWGNRDYGGGAVKKYEEIMRAADFTLLKGKSQSVTLENSKTILLTGIDDFLLGDPFMPEVLNNDDSVYRILLTHEPDAVEYYGIEPYDLILSGHSHGGQINIPFFPSVNQKAVSITELAAKYSKGMFTLNGGSKLYVNTGIGTTHISARFGVVPEISVFHIFLS